MKNKGKSILVVSILEYIVAFLAIIECNSVYSALVTFPKTAFYILFLIPLSLLIVVNFFHNLKSGNLSRFTVIFILLYALFFLSLYSIAYNPLSLVFRLGIIAPLMIVAYSVKNVKYNKFTFFFKMSDIIYYLAIISLFFWVTVSVLHVLPLNTTVIINWGSVKAVRGFLGVYFETQTNGTWTRNTGIFAEGPMHNFVLCFAMTVETFFRLSKKKFRIFVLALAIISTFTTTGFLFLVILVALQFVFLKSKSKIFSVLRIVLIPVFIILSIYLFNSILSAKEDSNSYAVRSRQIMQSIELWERSPLLGNGYGKSAVGNSNSIFLILGDGGLVLAAYYIVPFIFIPLYCSIVRKNKNFLLGSLLLFIIFCFTVIYNNLLTYLYIGLWYSVLINKKNNLMQN